MHASKTFRETIAMRPAKAYFEQVFDRGSKIEDRFFCAGLFARMSSDEWGHHIW
jgi:hypothetical protein